MEKTVAPRQAIRFGIFDLSMGARQLFKNGVRVKLQDQSFEILTLLVGRPGEVVTREELRQKLWPADTFVDFDHSLNTAIKRLRDALGDSAESPRFIETLPRHGYRFIAPLEGLDQASVELAARRNPAWYVWRVGLPLAALLAVLMGLNLDGWRHRLLGPGVSPRIRSLVVLPLENLSNDPAQEYFAEGMTDALTSDLAQFNTLRVISRTSAIHYRGARKTLPEIAKELNVDAVVEGAVVRSGDRVRISAQLIYAPTDMHLWAHSYEGGLHDVLALQNEVARDIANEIKIKLTPEERARLTNVRPVDPEAHELYLKGRYYWNKRTPETLKKSLEYFQRAVERDPGYAQAYAGLADSYLLLGTGEYGVLPTREALPKAEAAAMKALQLDSTLAEAHSTLGFSKLLFDLDWQGAEREFKRAIELNPGYANTRHWYALYLSMMGRHSEAIAEDRQAESLDPLSLIISADLAMEAFSSAGMYDQEMEQCRKTLEMDPDFAVAHACLSDGYMQKGMYDEAIVEMRKAIDLSGSSVVWVSRLGSTYALAGRRDKAIKILNKLKARSKREFVPAQLFAYIYAALGEKDQAFAWLEKAYEERSDIVVDLKTGPLQPVFDPLRSDPRFQDLMRRVGPPP